MSNEPHHDSDDSGMTSHKRGPWRSEKRERPRYPSTTLFLLLTIFAIFLAEGVVLLGFQYWSSGDPWSTGILEALLIVVLTFPVLYFFLYRPLVRQIVINQETERSLETSEVRLPAVLKASKEAIIAIRPDGTVSIWNPAAQTMFGWTEQEMLGETLDRIVPEGYRENHDRYANEFFHTDKRRRELNRTVEFPALRKGDIEFPIELTLSSGSYQDEAFVLAIARDISERKADEQEQVRLIEELQQATEDIRKMSGMIPICALCKKVSDDEGSWKLVESYIQQHSDAEFSHSLCPDCQEKLYPELNDPAVEPPSA